MLDYSIKLLNLFLYPFQDIFWDSPLGSVSLIAVVLVVIVMLVKVVREVC